MLARLKMDLDTNEWDYRKASRLQGFMMERLDSGYAEEMHNQQMHPYSQTILHDGESSIWQICALSAEACEQVVGALFGKVEKIKLNNEKQAVIVRDMETEVFEFSDLVAEFYQASADRTMTVDFLTPTAFKQNGRYFILPDVRLICQSLMLRQASMDSSFEMMDAEALQDIAENCQITRHKIRSVIFPAEGTKIPGFMGSVTFRCFGTETMARYLRLLLRFGEFSGVGIKTGMGMGAMRLRREAE